MSLKNKRKEEPPKESTVQLKLRITELESEVLTLKQRLDSLRKAKNNTITKREREIIQVGEPGLGRPVGVETEKYRALEKRLLNSESQRQNAENELGKIKSQMEEHLRGKSDAEKNKDEWKIICNRLEEKCKKLEEKAADHGECNVIIREKTAANEELTVQLLKLHEKLEIKATQEENKTSENISRETYIDKLSTENAILREKVEGLYEELSLKEAKWTDWEGRFIKKTEEKWNDKYSEWIAKTETKIHELQEANKLLRGYFEKDKKVLERNVSGFTEEDERGESSNSKNE